MQPKLPLKLYFILIVPTDISVTPPILSTNVHWKFDDKFQTQIKTFLVEVSTNLSTAVHESPPSDRVATISGLASGTAHSVRVTAVYLDGYKARSHTVNVTTLGKYSLQPANGYSL